MTQPDAATASRDNRPSTRKRVQMWGERGAVILIVLGTLGLIQPFDQDFYTNGFTVLLLGTIVFIIASHL